MNLLNAKYSFFQTRRNIRSIIHTLGEKGKLSKKLIGAIVHQNQKSGGKRRLQNFRRNPPGVSCGGIHRRMELGFWKIRHKVL